MQGGEVKKEKPGSPGFFSGSSWIGFDWRRFASQIADT